MLAIIAENMSSARDKGVEQRQEKIRGLRLYIYILSGNELSIFYRDLV